MPQGDSQWETTNKAEGYVIEYRESRVMRKYHARFVGGPTEKESKDDLAGGLPTYYRRLEKGRFRWPEADQDGPIAISRRQLDWLLAGLMLEQSQAHREVVARKVA